MEQRNAKTIEGALPKSVGGTQQAILKSSIILTD